MQKMCLALKILPAEAREHRLAKQARRKELFIVASLWFIEA